MTIKKDKFLLTAIIPIGKTGGNLDLLYTWVPQVANYPLNLILIHDIADKETGPALIKFIDYFKEFNLTLVEGVFGSPGYARNAGLRLVASNWIAFWDYDDKPDLESIFSSIIEAEIEYDVLIGEFKVRNIIKNTVTKLKVNNPSFKSIAMNPGVWRMVFKYNVLLDLKFNNLKMGEDHVFLSDMKLAERKIKFIPKVFYEYSVGGENQLTNKKTALMDLPLATRLIYSHTKEKMNNKSIYFNMILMVRQQFTLLKKGNIFLRFTVLRFLLKLLIKPNLILLWLGLKAFLTVFLNLRKSTLK
jgi:glycosyltransferase involved in cell wall biosynthesis